MRRLTKKGRLRKMNPHDPIKCPGMLRVLCCVFPPAFGCCAHLKAGRNSFFIIFNLFLDFMFFSNLSSKSEKNSFLTTP